MNKSPYPPAEDTWQTIDAVKWLMRSQSGHISLIIDVGTGTGILMITSINEALKMGYKLYGLAIDVDINALYHAKLNIKNMNLHEFIDLINCESLNCLRQGVHGVIISNPPYLPGDWYEDWRIFGGENGRLVIDKLIDYACTNPVDYLIITQSSFSNWELTAIKLNVCGYKLIFIIYNHYFFEDILSMIFSKA